MTKPAVLSEKTNPERRKNGRELSRLVVAAVVSQRFRQLLLSDAGEAISKGYNGEKFILERHEREFILSIRADSLSDFAMQLVRYQEERDGSRNDDSQCSPHLWGGGLGRFGC